jgi:multisubunit Na+/H+ antiporter MnhB subunit
MALSSWWIALDLTLGASLLLVATAMFRAADAFSSIVLYITFGLLMALTWTRLGALDLALAEAAIGASVTGSLLLRGLADMERRQRLLRIGEEAHRRRRGRAGRLLGFIVLVPLGGALLFVVSTLPLEREGLSALAFAGLAASGIESPVTAVLLSYRAFDTLMELAVLWLAVMGAWGLALPPPARVAAAEPVLLSNVRLLAPASLLVGGYLLWLGAHAPGGAFQAGAVLAGASVLILLTRRPEAGGLTDLALRGALVFGLATFCVVGFASLSAGQPFLFYRGAPAKSVILVVEAAATISIAAALAAIFAGRPGERS